MTFTPEVQWGVGIVALLSAVVWGVVQYSRRNRAYDRVSNEAARAAFDNPEA